MANQHRIGKLATTVATDETGTTHVTYHQTQVVSFNCEKITLRTGGWRTVTTKTRMNQTAHQFNLHFNVFQKEYDWFVYFNGKNHPFASDTFSFDRSLCK